MSYLGIDIGTSCVKVVIIDDQQRCLAIDSISLTVSRPQPLWSEQNPEDWWHAVEQSIASIQKNHAKELAAVTAIGLTGQMHGAVCLDKIHSVLRPAILWNDGRSFAECDILNHHAANFKKINGNIVMPGFTAPKLLWINRNEPHIFEKISKVLLPKDYIRFRLSKEFASDLSDSSGTSWLNVSKRNWSEELLSATNLTVGHMPKLFEGNEVTGELSRDLAQRWGMKHPVLIVGGGGDNAAGAISIGVIDPEHAMLSIGTSGVYFIATDSYMPSPEGNFHTFCHCVPKKWHQMGVILSAASCLSWWSSQMNIPEGELIREVEQSVNEQQIPIFLPYLSGERTPHNNPFAQGIFFGLTHSSHRAELTRSVLEGVAFAMADCQQTLGKTALAVKQISIIGGGAKSSYWGQMLATILNKPLIYHDESVLGPAFGAARLAIMGQHRMAVDQVAKSPRIISTLTPQRDQQDYYFKRLEIYRKIYQQNKSLFGKV